jgi:hypothetical protein
MWADWIEEGLIDGPTAKGRKRGANPLWEYASGTVDRALTILKLKADGVTRFSALRLQLWLRGHELPSPRIKEDLHEEFERLLKKHFSRRMWSYDANDPNPDSPEKIERHKHKLQAVDPTLDAAGLRPSDDGLLALGSKLFWGPDRKTDSFEVLTSELSQKLGIPSDIIEMLFADLNPYISCVAGLFGNPDEIEKSGLSELSDLNHEDLINGRTFYQASLGLFEVGGKALALSKSVDASALRLAFEKTVRSLKTQEWSVLCFALGAIVSRRNRRNTDNGPT